MNFLVQIVTALSTMFDSSDSQILVGIPSRQIEQVAAAARGVAKYNNDDDNNNEIDI